MVIICDKKYNSLHLTRKKLTYHSTCIFWHYNYRNYWIFNCRYCISNVLIGSPNSSYQLMFQVTWYGITELMQRPKKRLLFKFYIVTSCIFFRISSPCFSTSATWISSRANLTAHITSCICYKMITLCLLLESFTSWGVKCQEREKYFCNPLDRRPKGVRQWHTFRIWWKYINKPEEYILVMG